ncbi:PTS cellobiose transporter subunit IIC [Bifidobacterium ramosum]|uniref:PTS cellobiose transporter subunit IIC n=2 Tax=Bifidobacterium ramosum TaxID=1798158 RepID=A0A6L4WYW0_9BIFI|nr:PTS cellobiose transporter subunit IIC [Bifidobacterium ramosum]
MTDVTRQGKAASNVSDVSAASAALAKSTAEELAAMGPIRRWIATHPTIWEFILFNVLSNISTVSRFVVTWIGTAVFVGVLGLTAPFHFLIFNYPESGNGLGGFLTFLFAEVIAQVVNFFVQMKWVFKSDSSFADAAWKYAILAVVIVVVNLVLPGYVTALCQGWGLNAGIAGTIASVVNTLLAVVVSYPILKFWIMPKK